jgi:hypothetical protein
MWGIVELGGPCVPPVQHLGTLVMEEKVPSEGSVESDSVERQCRRLERCGLLVTLNP